MESRSQRFETLLDRATGALDRARHQHELVEGVPDEFVAALQGFDSRLEDLTAVGRISDEDLQEAETVCRHAELLDSLLGSLGQFDADLVEYDVERLRIWVEHCSNLAERHGNRSLRSEVSDVESNLGLFETLVESNKHARVRSNEQVTPSGVDATLRELDAEIRESVSLEAYRSYCLQGTEAFIDRIHDLLADLQESHPQQTAFGGDMHAVKDQAESAREDEDADAARTALEGAMMIHAGVARALCRQQHAKRLADAIREHDIPSETDPYELAAEVELDALMDVIAMGVSEEVDQSNETRFRRLLSEHDGSVRRTMEASEYSPEEVFDQVRSMYEAGAIADLSVTFDE